MPHATPPRGHFEIRDSPPADPALWAQFAAAALEAIVATQKTADMHVEDFRGRHADAADEAAAYADALSAEYARRFIQEVK